MTDPKKHRKDSPSGEEEHTLPGKPPPVNSSVDLGAGSRLTKPYPVGRHLQCRVTKVHSAGVEAHPIGAPEVHAFVHRHEWTWLRRILELSDHAHVGDHFEARVQGYDRAGLILSRKQCLPNPYELFKRNHRPGDLVHGRFQLLVQNQGGILLQIGTGETAISGFVPRRELPPAAIDLDGFGLMVGDLLSARIREFHEEQVLLSVREQLRRRDVWITATENREITKLQYNPKLGLTLERLYYQQRLAEAPGLSPSALVREEIRRILLIEDEEDVATSLGDALARAGFEVQAALGSVGMSALLQKNPVDLLVLDRNLHGAEGTDLLDEPTVLDAVRFVCILTGTASPEIYGWHADLAAQGRLLVLDKPTSPSVLFDRLDDFLSQQGSVSALSDLPLGPPLPGEDTQVSNWLPQQFGRLEQLDLLLAELRGRYGADYACVLSYEEGPLFRLVAGNFVKLTREAQQRLELSPVGNAIREHSHIFDSSIGEAAKGRYQHLREVIQATAFLGLGIGYSDQARYGVFLINDTARSLRPFSPEERSLWELRITQHLIETRFATALVENQTLLLKGLLTSALLHEVGNRLQTLADHSALQVDVAHEFDGSNRRLDEAQLVDLLKSVEGIRGATKNLEDLVSTFRNLFGTDTPERVRLDRLLANLEHTFRSVANREGLYVRVEVEDQIPAVILNPKLLEQPILNLLLNAKEQMALRGSAMRRIWLIAKAVTNYQFPIQIRVRDTGPGIHAGDYERIFDLFFTTKPKGTGLGLFIARLLVERFGGQLRLGSSSLYEGSEFCIDLPATVIR